MGDEKGKVESIGMKKSKAELQKDEKKGRRPGGKVESRVSDIAGSKTTGKRSLDE